MNSERPSTVSVLDPITPAINRVKLMLFEPFDLGKWFVIGFCAWLSNLGSGGNSGGNGVRGRGSVGPENFNETMNGVKEYVLANLAWIVPLVLVGMALIIMLWLLFIWLSSRGRFMFLHCVAGNKAEVKIPWAKFREHANSLFLFRIVLGLISFVIILLPVILMIVLICTLVSIGAAEIGAILGVVFLVLSIIFISVCLGLVSKFTTDFVVPIMFLRTISVRTAWREFLTILLANKGRFLLYILFQIVIAIAIGAIILTLSCVTCCCACCLFMLPYLGTVALLPIFIFKRAYSLYYFQQYGQQFDVFNVDVQSLQPELP